MAIAPRPGGPAPRQIPVKIFTHAGWIMGAMHVPGRRNFVDHLNATRDWLKLTGVRMPGSEEQTPFLALRRASASIIVPSCPPAMLLLKAPSPGMKDHQVTCLLESGALYGHLQVPGTIRVSDYLTSNREYMLLQNCTFGEEDQEITPIVIVNATTLIAVSE